MKKAMKQLFQKGISGILCAAMILTSLSIPEMTAYAAETEITEETETADKTNDGITNESDGQDTDSETAKESEDIPETDNKDKDSDSDADKDDVNSEVGGGDLADDSAETPDETAPKADDADIEAADVEFDEAQTPTPRAAGSVTLNYYVGDVEEGEEIGIYQWGGLTFYSEVENEEDGTTEEKAATAATTWHPWGNSSNTAYLMTPNAQYAGWYSINIKVDENLNANANFEIFRSTNTGTSMIKCGQGTNNENAVIFSALTKNDGSVCAVKDFGTDGAHSYKLFEGTDAVNAAMRNVTLHVYSVDGIPAIMASDEELKKINEDDGSEETMQANFDKIDGSWHGYYYHFDKDDAQENWYKLTFIVPDKKKGWSAEIFKLFLYNKADSEAEASDSDYKDLGVVFFDGVVDWGSDTDVDFVTPVLVEGKTYYKDGKFSESSGITFGALKKLIEDVGKLVESEYTTESWGKLQTALKEANDVVTLLTVLETKDTDVDAEGSTEIADAYNDLDEAKKGLEKKSSTITFSYYAGDTDGKGVGVYTYSANNNISSDADNAEWKVWESQPVYEMTPAEYSGWYTIPITFTGDVTDQANFQVFIQGAADSVFKCGTTNDSGNVDIYIELFTGTDTSYAVKKVGDEFKLFKGDAADAVMRNVTLNIYSESGVPTIVVGEQTELAYIDESTQTTTNLDITTTNIDGWNNNCYEMKADGTTNWYSLSFTVPTPDDNGKFFDLYIKDTESGAYTWNAKFMSTDSTDETAPNFKSALETGKTYYKDGVFYKSPDEIKKVTLGALRALVETAEAEESNKDKYTKTSWDALTAALEAANAIVEKNEGKDDNYTDEDTSTEIKDAYDTLDAAIKGLKENGKEIIFNYYVGDTNGKGVGIYQYGGKVSSSANIASWQAWGTQPVYEMTPAGYSGWYTIPLEFTGEVSANANFQVFVEDANESVFKCGGSASNDKGGAEGEAMYATFLAAEADTPYAVRQFGTSYILYEGTDEVNAAMRNVTLYVYSADDTPVIKSDTELNYIDESDGSKKKHTADDTKSGETDGVTWNNYFYNMKSVEGKQNWYSLTFSAPDVVDLAKVCELYIGGTSGDDWEMNFINGPVADDQKEWNVDFTPVFSGSVYYNDGQFYTSMDLAEGITLKMLEELLGSDKITAIVNNGGAGYTAESWTTFDNAYKAADELAKACRADDEKNADGYKSEDITAKYTALSTAADTIVPLIQAPVVTLYYYSEDLDEYTDTETVKHNLYMSVWNKAKVTSTKEEVSLSQGTWDYAAYEFEKVTDEEINKGYDNWYAVPVKLVAAGDGASGDGFIIQIGKATTQDGTIKHEAISSNVSLIELSAWNNKSIYDAIVNAGDGGVVAVKNGKMYSSIEEAAGSELIALRELYEEAAALKKTDYQDDENWSKFQTELANAKAVLDKGGQATDEEILEAYNSLEAAIKALVYKTSASIDVKKVELADDFITGADLSSYVSLKQSGVVFKDENGKALSDSEFFKYLKDGGTNWVRIRVWNDPYNSNGDGYGGGNSDLDKAKIIGKLATDAGMRVLIDFHYSDFWADPSKQDAPKAWEGYSLEEKEKAVYDYTLDSLNALKSAGVDVGMVQVGNETNNGICGEKGWDNMAKIFSAGSNAVKYFNANANADVAEDRKCLVAIHFADPSSSVFASYAKNLFDKDVDYDVFAASYYPFWHGTAEGMYDKLHDIAKDYGKKVMVAETSWVTTWEDGDGHGNTSPKTTQTLAYPVSVQGQADEMVDVISNVNKINKDYPGKAIGVFYWEPAWISPYYVYNAGSRDENLYNKNKELWEKYGSGWASSYSTEYDPTDAGRWYGGSAVDNQAWFDFNGKALATAKMYSYIRTGASATERINEIVNVENEIIKQAYVGDEIPWPDENDIVVTFNDGIKSTDEKGKARLISISIKWNEDQKALVNTDKAGTFTVDGTVVCTYKVEDGDESKTKSETYDICLTLEVLSTSNILKNAGFEINDNSWTRTLSKETDASFAADPKGDNHHAERRVDEDPHGGSWGWHFYSTDAINFTIEQEVSDLKAGTYTVGGFIQGNGAASKDLQTLYVTVVDSKGSKTTYESTCSLNGWLNWVNPEIANIKVSDGDTLTVGVEIESTVGGAWGTIDDMYMYGKYGIELGDIEHGTVNVSNMEPDSGEVVNIAAMPENGYYLSELKLIGKNVNDKTSFKDTTKNAENVKYAGDAAYTTEGENGVLTLTYNSTEDQSDKTMSAAFVMTEGMVTLQARFTEISFNSAVDISSDDVKVKGFTESVEGEYVCDTPQEYTGKKIELDLELTYKGYKLTSADYSAQYKNNVKVTGTGKAEITIKAKGKKFTGSRKLYFNIVDNKVDISKAKAVLTGADDTAKDIYYYTGDEITPVIKNELKDKTGSTLKTKDGTADLTLDSSDYTIDYQKNIKVGKATMTVIAKSDSAKIKGSFTQTFTIAKRPITDSKITISMPAGATYTGSKITPNVTIKFGNKVLKNGTDYTLTYKNNVKVSTGAADALKPSIKITGKGSYTGSTDTYNGKKITFEISAKDISDYGINVTADDIAEGKVPKITLRDGKKTLALNKQYIIDEIVKEGVAQPVFKYDENARKVKPAAISDTGTYTATIKGIDKSGYNGECSVEFRVVKKEQLLSSARIKVVPKSKLYTGSPVTLTAKTSESDTITPELEVTDNKGNALYYNTDYTISYNDVYGEATNIKAGKATVTIKGMGEYAGTKSAKFTIAKNAVTKDANDEGKAVITWEVQADTILDKIEKKIEANKKQDSSKAEDLYLPYTGYNWTPELDIYATNAAGSKKLLTKDKDYTITYKNNQKANSKASITIKGKGNYSGTVKFDNVFTVKDVTLNDFVITVNPVEYSGKAVKPAIRFIYKEIGTVIDLKPGAAYSVKYKNNKNVASIESAEEVRPSVTITEKGLNASKKGADKTQPAVIPFTITTARITSASISEIKDQTYKGKPVKPTLNIKVNGKKLKEGKDYVVTYTGNSGPNDKATARIIGIGNYTGTVSKEFVIK